MCEKTGFESLEDIMAVVTKIVTLIPSLALNKKRFDTLLDEVKFLHRG